MSEPWGRNQFSGAETLKRPLISSLARSLITGAPQKYAGRVCCRYDPRLIHAYMKSSCHFALIYLASRPFSLVCWAGCVMACRQLSCRTLVSGVPLLGAMVSGQAAEPQDLQARIEAARLALYCCMIVCMSTIMALALQLLRLPRLALHPCKPHCSGSRVQLRNL